MITKKFDYRIYAIHTLRINIKSLVAEARFIRSEAKRCGEFYRNPLTEHRRGKLREHLRIAHLALAFIRKTPYRSVEKSSYTKIDPVTLHKKVVKHYSPYGYTPTPEEITKWLNG